MTPHKLCALIPVYNHGATVVAVHARLAALGLPCVLVDDGSAPDCAAILDALATRPDTHLLRRARNGGKGAAVQDGLRAAHGLGYTHALQVDADGQHALDDAPAFAQASRAQPAALICGAPIYGSDVPRSRFYGRWLTRVWVWINTLSLDIPDAMCGFRVYPLDPVLRVIDGGQTGRRMDFDISILVRLHWRGLPMVWLPTRVIYPEDGISHFKTLRDNLLISRMHARLFCGMLARSPALLRRRLTGARAAMPGAERHWAGQPERGHPVLLRLTAWAARRLGRRALAPVVWLVVLYFYAFGPRARRAIGAYQRRLTRAGGLAAPLPRPFPVYRQYLAFAQALLDKLDVWRDKITLADLDIADPDGLHAQMGAGRGQILVGSHLGNIEVCRALAEKNGRLMLNVLVHTKHAAQFGRLLDEAGGGLRMIQVSELDAGVMLDLAQRLERGEWLAIAGDRVPLQDGRSTQVKLLGEPALLPQGPWLLAGLLRCPVNLLFCIRHGTRYRVSMERLSDGIEWSRATRQDQIARWTQRYADRLGAHCLQAPLQWFNFYPFWKDDA